MSEPTVRNARTANLGLPSIKLKRKEIIRRSMKMNGLENKCMAEKHKKILKRLRTINPGRRRPRKDRVSEKEPSQA